MKSRLRTLKRGLFSRTLREVAIDLNNLDELMAWSESQKYGSELLEHNLSVIRDAARQALRNLGLPENTRPHDELEGNAALGAEVLDHLRTLEAHRRHKRLDDAIHETMMAVQRWMELRANVFFEKPVRARQKQLERLPHTKSVSDDQIRTALADHGMAEAAQKLGITERQIRNRLPAQERRSLAETRKRKSVRFPPGRKRNR